jgi:hypothetical protein
MQRVTMPAVLSVSLASAPLYTSQSVYPPLFASGAATLIEQDLWIEQLFLVVGVAVYAALVCREACMALPVC